MSLKKDSQEFRPTKLKSKRKGQMLKPTFSKPFDEAADIADEELIKRKIKYKAEIMNESERREVTDIGD